MKTGLFFIFVLSAVPLFAEQPRFPNPKNADETWQNDRDLQNQIRNLRSTHYTPTFSTTTITGPLTALATTQIGIGPVFNLTGTPTTGGTLNVPASYYYKIFPVQANGQIGGPSSEITVFLDTPTHSTSLSWTAVNLASFYRVERGVSPGGPVCEYVTSSAAYVDTNATCDGLVFNSDLTKLVAMEVNGSITLPASSGQIYWRDYVTNTSMQAHIGPSSTGEMEYNTPSFGITHGYHVFEDQNATFITLNRRPNDGQPRIAAFYNGGASYGGLRVTVATMSVSIADSDTQTFDFVNNGFQIGAGKSLILLNAAGDAGGTIVNNQVSGIRALSFQVGATTGIFVTSADGGTTHIHQGITVASSTAQDVLGNYLFFANNSGFVLGDQTGVALGRATLVQLHSAAYTPFRAGLTFYCSTCVTDAICVSTGTAIGSYAGTTVSRTTPCQ